jgi:arylsulfatase
MPTLLDIADASYPKTREGQELPKLLGKSWVPLLAGQTDAVRTDQDYLAWELFGNRAVRQGEWKLRWQFKPFGKDVSYQHFDQAHPNQTHMGF